MLDICTYSLRGDLEKVKILLQRGVDVDMKDELFHSTALHLAASKGHVEIVKVLLEAGADIYTRDDIGHTPLHLAAHAAARVNAEDECQLERYYQIFEMLLRKEAELRISGQPIKVLLKNSKVNQSQSGTPADFMRRNKQVQDKFLEIVRDIEVNCPTSEPESSSYCAFTKKDRDIKQRRTTVTARGEAIGETIGETTAGLDTVIGIGIGVIGARLGMAIANLGWYRQKKDKNEEEPLLDESTQDTSGIRKKPHFL